MLTDARSVPSGTEFACDLCVVGAGPAGIAIADRLSASGLSIFLLESGGFDPELATQKLFRGVNDGHQYYRLDACRFRVFGGSLNRWGGWCRPLEPADYLPRDWLPGSGWPIREETVEPYYADTARLCELRDSRFDLDAWRDRLPPSLPLAGSNFESVFFQYSPETNFAQVYGARLLTDPHVRIFMYANVTQIVLESGSRRVAALDVATLTGRTFQVRPGAVVLAAGGIENARVLLASRADRPGGVGNEHDMVGRFFMEHLHVPAGHLLAAANAGLSFYRKAFYKGVRIRGVVTPTAAAQDRHRLLSTSIAIEQASYNFGTPFLGWPPPVTFGPIRLYRKAAAGRFKDVVETLKQTAEQASGLSMRARTWNAARLARRRSVPNAASARVYSLYFRSEQAPDPASRVRLDDRRDALGVPEVRLDWRVNPVDVGAITGWLGIFDRDLRARGLGEVIAPPDGWETGIIGGPHHIGTTRMSADPRHGVVDEHCRVHSVDNLYVAGSSVFATGGYANPTFTLLALALRLADTLRDRLRKERSLHSSS